MSRRLLIALAVGAVLLNTFPLHSIESAHAGVGDVAVLVEGQTLPRGLTELSVDDVGRITGRFELNGARIAFETRRGPETPWILRATDPRTPPYEIDVRFVDENGVPFLVQVGGHGAMDAEWESSFHTSSPLLEHHEQEVRQPFLLAGKAIKALRSVKFRSDLAPEHRAILGLASVVEKALLTEKIEVSEAPAEASCTYRHKVEIHDASCCVTLGRHSATIAWNITSSGKATRVWVTSNHGRSAADMPLKCSWTSSANRCQISVAPMCSTPYDAFSRSGKHNCNDDTGIQYGGIRGAYSPSPTAGLCKDSSRNDKSPSCS